MDARDCTHIDNSRQEKTIDLKKQIEYHEQGLKYHAQALSALKGNKKKEDPVKAVCKHFGISKRDLAQAIIFNRKGDITKVKLANMLSLDRKTLWNWHEVRQTLKKARKPKF